LKFFFKKILLIIPGFFAGLKKTGYQTVTRLRYLQYDVQGNRHTGIFIQNPTSGLPPD
jgi:hypothetical protein